MTNEVQKYQRIGIFTVGSIVVSMVVALFLTLIFLPDNRRTVVLAASLVVGILSILLAASFAIFGLKLGSQLSRGPTTADRSNMITKIRVIASMCVLCFTGEALLWIISAFDTTNLEILTNIFLVLELIMVIGITVLFSTTLLRNATKTRPQSYSFQQQSSIHKTRHRVQTSVQFAQNVVKPDEVELADLASSEV